MNVFMNHLSFLLKDFQNCFKTKHIVLYNFKVYKLNY